MWATPGTHDRPNSRSGYQVPPFGTRIGPEVVQLPKYALIGGYTSEAWAKMVENPGDRAAAVRKVT